MSTQERQLARWTRLGECCSAGAGSRERGSGTPPGRAGRAPGRGVGVATRVRAEGGSEGRTEPRGEGSLRTAGFLLPLREAGGLGSSPRAALNLRDPYPLLLGPGGAIQLTHLQNGANGF